MRIGSRHFLFSRNPMLQVPNSLQNIFPIEFVFVDAIIAIGLLDSGCVKLWAFDPRTATTNVRILKMNFF